MATDEKYMSCVPVRPSFPQYIVTHTTMQLESLYYPMRRILMRKVRRRHRRVIPHSKGDQDHLVIRVTVIIPIFQAHGML